MLVRNALLTCMNSARCIFLAAFSMAADGEATKAPGLGWPGDLKAAGRIANLSDYVTLLVRNGYLQPGDLKIFAGPGFKPYQGRLTSGSNGVLDPPFTEENCAYKVYLVKKEDPSGTVFLASKNSDKGIVILRTGGDVGIYKTAASARTCLLPGGGTVESAENCLNPSPSHP